MKKILVLLLASSLVMATTACTPKQVGSPSSNLVSATPPVVSDAPSSSSVPSSESDVPTSSTFEILKVADAAMYRGTVTNILDNNDNTVVTIRRANGTSFDMETLTFLVTKDTKLSFEPDKLVTGVYLEVYYGSKPGEKPTKDVDAIAINLYPSAEIVIFNGTIKAIEPNAEKEGEGRLVMDNLEREEEVVFNYDQANTQFYLTFDDLKVGDKLNIFHRGVYTRSMPPQGSAIEVQKYVESNK